MKEELKAAYDAAHLKTEWLTIRNVSLSRDTQTLTVCVFGTSAGDALERPFTINLSKCAPDTIISVLEEVEHVQLMFRMRVNPSQFLTEK